MIIHPLTMTTNVPQRDQRTAYGIVNGDGDKYLMPAGQYSTQRFWTEHGRRARTWPTEDDAHMLATLANIQREEDAHACLVVFHR
jgi:hypothetical protein